MAFTYIDNVLFISNVPSVGKIKNIFNKKIPYFRFNKSPILLY